MPTRRLSDREPAASGADTLFNVTTPKFAAQSIRKVYDIGWKPLHILNNVSASVGAVLKPAGLDKSVGLITAVVPEGPGGSAMEERPRLQGVRGLVQRSTTRRAISMTLQRFWLSDRRRAWCMC